MSYSLCSTCRSINFRKYIYTKRLFAIKLGSWEKLSRRNHCSFCSLAKAAILLYGHRPSPRTIIKLSNKKSWKCCTSYNEYHGTREMDYSNKFDLHSYATDTRTESRHQFYLSWNNRFHEVYLRPIRSGPFFGRLVEEEVDFELCRTWLDLCEKYHSGSSKRCTNGQTSRRFLQDNLRLIDVKNMIIVKGLGENDEYVALTHVWGEAALKRERPAGWQMPRTLKKDIRTDENGDEVVELPHEIPRTIRDAIDVTRSLGYRYLWVDAFCIVQDDKMDQDIQLDMMDEIYSNATLTIAAGSGLHADWGLPGISRRRRYPQRTATVGELELAVALPSFQRLNSGTALVWNTRGWTLQEKLLSKRLLLFTDYQVYFRCANSICTEDIAMEAGALSRSIKRRQNPFAWVAPRIQQPNLLDKVADALTFENWKLAEKDWDLHFLPNYIALITEFTQRTFTFSEDRLKAVSGLLKVLDGSRRAFPGGLPRDWLAETLLWQPREGSPYSIDADTIGIPTWSWAAWSLSEGCVWTEYSRPNGLACQEPEITVHTLGSGGNVTSYCVWPSRQGFFGNKRNDPDSLTRNARQLLRLSGTMLSFHTSIRTFWIGVPVEKTRAPKDVLQAYYLEDSKGLHVGKIWTCDRVVRARNKHHLIALSSRKTGLAIKGAVAGKYIPSTTDSEGNSSNRPAGDWKVMNVMLVVWKGDVAYRVAIGQVIKEAWDHWSASTKKGRIVYLG